MGEWIPESGAEGSACVFVDIVVAQFCCVYVTSILNRIHPAAGGTVSGAFAPGSSPPLQPTIAGNTVVPSGVDLGSSAAC